MAEGSGKLRARAGPRIRSALVQVDGCDGTGSDASGSTCSRRTGRLRWGFDRPEQIAHSILQDLRSRRSELIPWTGLRTRSISNVVVCVGGCLGAIGTAAAALVDRMPVGAALGVAAALFVIGLLYVRRPSHRARRLGRQIAARLRAGASLEDVADRLMELIEREPRDDAARLLVALYLLQTEETLSALLQLAPLRDRHPNSGEVVLLAALAYVSLGRPLDAAALLEVLEVPPDHPWNKEIHRLRRCCRPIRGSGRGLPRPAGTLAPVGSEGESLAD